MPFGNSNRWGNLYIYGRETACGLGPFSRTLQATSLIAASNVCLLEGYCRYLYGGELIVLRKTGESLVGVASFQGHRFLFFGFPFLFRLSGRLLLSRKLWADADTERASRELFLDLTKNGHFFDCASLE